MRDYSFLDQLIIRFDQKLLSLFGQPQSVSRVNPASKMPEDALSSEQKGHSAGLMRINHVGEVCAQALYEGQALTARNATIKTVMQEAAIEEMDHLSWCAIRLNELDSHPSYLNLFWYTGAFSIGVLMGMLGDRWSLGFLAETEKQVVAHISDHLQQLPANDYKSQAILAQMKVDEDEHATMAIQYGAMPLPDWFKKSMQGVAWVMKKVSYWV